MWSVLRGLLLPWLLCFALAACSDSSSTHVFIKVDNSIDGEDRDPNLIVAVVVRDDDEAQPAPAPTSSSLAAAMRSTGVETAAAPQEEADLAYVALTDAGSSAAINAGSSHWLIPGDLGEPAGLTWSFDGTQLFVVGRDGLYSTSGAELRSLIRLAGAAAADGGPALEVEIDGAPMTLEVIAVIARISGGLEDVFAIYVDSAGRPLGLENLTQTPEVGEIDAAWLHDGTRLAVLERAERDAIVVRNVSFGAGGPLPVHAELESGGSPRWEAPAGTLRDLSAARTRDLLAFSAWTGQDWDVLCVDARGNAANLGSPTLDESAPSWSRDDRLLAVEQRCALDACGPLPILIWQLESLGGSAGCPRVSSSRSLTHAGSLPVWRP